MLFRKSLGLIVVLLLTACAVKKPEKFSQGQGVGLETIESYQGKVYSLHTGKKVGSIHATKFENVSISSELESNGVNQLGLVEYTTDAKLLGPDYPFIGREFTTYEIRVEVDSSKLMIFKVAPRENIAFQELTSLKPEDQLSDGRLKVLLVSYGLKGLYRIEKKLNEKGDETRELIEVSESDLNRATHLRIDFNSRQVPETLVKTDLYPKDLLGDPNDLWYYSATITDTSAGREELIGDSGSGGTDAHFTPATLVRILPLEKSLRAVNVARAPEIDTQNAINVIDDLVLEIPIERKAFKMKKAGGTSDLREELDQKVAPMSRPYMEIKFEDLIETKSSHGSNTDSKKVRSGIQLADLEIARDYLGFTVLKIEEAVRVRYNFLKVGNRKYERRLSFSSDRSKHFGFFTQSEPILESWKNLYKKDQKHEFIVRQNPAKSKIVFHFSTKTPKDEAIRNIGRKAIAAWNQAQSKALTQVQMLLDETRDVTIGDLRYNVIDIIVTESESFGLLGYGPSVIDPNSGEIISSSANLHFNAIRPALVSRIREHIRENSGVNETRHLPVYEWAMSKSKSHIEKLIAKRCSGSVHPAQSLEAYVRLLKETNSNLGVGWRHSVLPSGDTEVIEACLDQIMPEYALQVLLHEIGHTLGLRHNFKGSIDTQNQSQYSSSSVMDYLAWEAEPLVEPGQYDIAALRFGYAMEVETQSGSWVRVDPTQSLDQQFASSLKSYQFCTDEDLIAANDPLCRQFDLGRNPLEVSKYLLMRADQNFLKLFFRNDKARMYDPVNAFRAVADDLGELQKFYIEGRNQLLTSGLVAGNQKYLEGMDDDEFSKIEDQIQQAMLPLRNPIGTFDDIFESRSDSMMEKVYHFRAAGDLFVKSMLSLVLMPNRVCILENDFAGSKTVEEFETVRGLVFQKSQGKISIRSCSDPAVLNYLGARRSSEKGYSIEDLRYSLEEKDLSESLDILGVSTLRKFASAVLTTRVNGSDKSKDKRFYPSPLDEPGIRKKLLNELVERALFGMDLGDGNRVPLFSSESELILSFFSDFGKRPNQGVLMDENFAESQRRVETLSSKRTDRVSVGYAGAVHQEVFNLIGDTLYVVDNQKNADALRLLKHIQDLQMGPKKASSEAESLAQKNLIISILDLYSN